MTKPSITKSVDITMPDKTDFFESCEKLSAIAKPRMPDFSR
jgi:hypothetical protein